MARMIKSGKWRRGEYLVGVKGKERKSKREMGGIKQGKEMLTTKRGRICCYLR